MLENNECVNVLKNGGTAWNKWREEKQIISPVLRNVDFSKEFWGNDFYDAPEYNNVDFSNTDFNSASLRNCIFLGCTFDYAKMTFCDLVDAYFQSCTFINTNMQVSRLGSAKFNNCVFDGADLSYCTAQDSSFEKSQISNTKLEKMSLVNSDFTSVTMENCFVYGISAWDLKIDNIHQKELRITEDNKYEITVDDIELAQFMYLLINNSKLRETIDTITSKVVLILGNFSKKRKPYLDYIKNELQLYNLMPVLFDFTGPTSKDTTETIITFAALSKCVIADLSCPKSVPHELASFVRFLPSTPVFPILQDGESGYSMFNDYKAYSWVRPVKNYNNENLNNVVKEIVDEIK
ncbi:MAG: pentapeptide repeat-containing protein [Alphaproteobacteria bacterium]|nr:pentapeptide repeat-containing protein [Alphaproteobacteria bacterium]